MTRFRTNPKTWEEIRRILQRIQTYITDTLGTMSTQDADNVSITGGSIAGADIDVTGKDLTLDDKQVDLAKVGTSETDATKAVVPDGSGGLSFGEPGTSHARLHNLDGTDDHNGVSGATEDNLIAFDANGLPKDSGSSPASFDAAGTADTAVSDHEADADPHPQYLTATEGEAAYDALGAAAAVGGDLTSHLNDTDDAHDASAISVAATPDNYTPASADVEAHLAAIDAELAEVGPGGGEYRWKRWMDT